MFELRVLTGLHQGAALPLFGEQWSIGASQDADLALYDPGISERHVQLRCAAGRWSVQAEQGLLQDDTGQPQAQIPDLGTNTLFSIAQVRLYVADADQPWPQLPTPASTPAIDVEDYPQSPPSSAPTLRHKRFMGIAALVALVIVALGLTPTEESQSQASLRPALEQKNLLSSAYEVRQQLLKMLEERELAHRFALEVINGQISIDGTGSRDELALISRMLDRFQEQFDTPVPVISRVRERNTRLPFKIVQIVGGKNGHVVLEDGHRLFLGDEVEGLRLTVIDNDKVVFDGQQRYEVDW
ncbi:FHA domain-containing protein [Pseudomonas mucidolens]|uniref:Type III secretion protein D n=1 Tax=Pseudomonas mucidolens TaxID=46679 RepID=A0A1H2NH61_9PSED|nr:FHA domain-containing protein [Pseudomonas mucidolens]SDV04704.1 type III secretion protein D [Pseudomonas mucidolens]SQH31943.1 YscD/HrpQ family type III secretion apparatus protein [Pseudomonas mucidolens]